MSIETCYSQRPCTLGINAAQPAVAPGEAVILSTGWEKHWGTDRYRSHPYLSGQAAAWLIDQGVTMVGMDLMTPDLPGTAREGGFAFPVHHMLLGAEVLIIENMTGLTPLHGRRIELHALPIPIDADDGAPIRAIGRVLR